MWRIRDRETFDRLRRSRDRARCGAVAVTRAPLATGRTQPAVAFAIGRKAGNAVVRNRLRRQLRAAIEEAAPRPAAYLVSVTPAAAGLSGAALREDLATALESLGALTAAKGAAGDAP